jgi:hypothetical protein
MHETVGLAIGALVVLHHGQGAVLIPVPLIDLAVAGAIYLDVIEFATGTKTLPLIRLAVAAGIKGDLDRLAFLKDERRRPGWLP